MAASLTLHRGAREVERSHIERLDAPPQEGQWFPIAHRVVLDHVERLLQDGGFAVKQARYALSRGDNRFFAALDMESTIAEGVSLSCGVMNSTDRSIGIRFLVGERIWICDNLSYSSSHVVSSKHSRHGLRRFHGKLAQVVQGLPEHVQASAQRLARLRHLEVPDDLARSVMLQMFEKGIVSARLLPKLIEEYWQSTCFEPGTGWALWNAATAVLKSRLTQPAVFASLTIQLTGLMDRCTHLGQAA